jgi:hypothetical protein
MEVSIRVCDICEDPSRATTRYTVEADGVTGSTDRCEEHGETFALVLAGRGVVPAKRARPARAAEPATFPSESPAPRRTSRTGRQRVVSMDQIEEGKRRR